MSNSEYIQSIRGVVEHTVKTDLAWYRKYTTLAAFAHRAAGISVIILSASLPLVVTHNFPRKELVVSIIGALIAIISGLNSFYRFGDLWKTNMKGMVELKNQMANWELGMLEAERDSVNGAALALKSTKELLSGLIAIDTKNSEDYIGTINFPTKQP